MTSVHEITSEVAYDLMQDHLETLLTLQEAPRPVDETVQRLGCSSALARLERHGLVRVEDGTVHSVSHTYNQVRQEGMMTFLDRYVLPGLTAAAAGESTLEVVHMALTGEQIECFAQTRLVPLTEELQKISDQPSDSTPRRLSLIFVGTSRALLSEQLATPREERALHILKQASIQRSTRAERSGAVIGQVDMLADIARYTATAALLSRFTTSLGNDSNAPTFHFAVATHWRPGVNGEVSRQLC